MDVRLAEPIARAVTQAVVDGDTGYPHGSGYAEAFAAFAAERWSWDGVDPGRTALVADVMTGIVEAIGLVSSPGDPVVVNTPVYPPFFGFLEHADREIVEAPLGDGGRLDLDSLEAAFIHARADGRPVTYLLCNPQNPTAVVHTAEELAGVAALAQTYGARVVVDEIHAPLVAEGFVPYLSVDGSDNAFSLVSATKAWNLAGMKAALLVAGEECEGGSRAPVVGCRRRSQPLRRARAHDGVPGGWRLARRVACRPRRQPGAAGRAARDPPAGCAVGPRAGDVPGVDRLPRARPRRRPGSSLPRARAGSRSTPVCRSATASGTCGSTSGRRRRSSPRRSSGWAASSPDGQRRATTMSRDAA